MTELDVDHLRAWISKQETLHDQVTRFPIAALSATLDRDDPAPLASDALPPLWHWLYFLPTARQSILGPDGHPARGGFLPPVPLPRRMWAGGRFTFHQPLRVDEAITRTSTVQDVTIKQGRNGARCASFLVKHEISSATTARRWLKSTTSSIATCRDPNEPVPAAARQVRTDDVWRRDIVPSEPMLFRYSGTTGVQQPPHSLRPTVRHRNRGLSRPDRARPADRHSADRSVAPEYVSTGGHLPLPRGQPAVRYRTVLGAWRN